MSSGIVVDHKVDSALQFVVTGCNPGEIGFDFRQDQGTGNIALRLSAPLHFKRLAGTAMPDLQSDERLGSH